MKQTLGQRIRAVRVKLGLTQDELAEKAGVGQATVSGWEAGTCYPSDRLLLCVANAMGKTMNDLKRGTVG